VLTKCADPRPKPNGCANLCQKNVVLSHVGFDAGEIKIEQAYYRGMLGTAENETQPQNVIFALPSPTVFGRNRRSDEAKIGPRLTRKSLMRANFRIALEKLGRQKINSPSRHQSRDSHRSSA
jgi:hypothetical protein